MDAWQDTPEDSPSTDSDQAGKEPPTQPTTCK